jgi:putative acyl-CoA dehydrogenase
MRPSEQFITHSVDNQATPLADYNAYLTDTALQEAVAREGGGWGAPQLSAYGAITGGEMIALGQAANENKPKLRSFDRYGHRIDEVEFHPAYHRVMELGMAHGVHAFAWRNPRPGAQVIRAGLEYLHHQAEQGTNCPLTMTYACVPALRHQPELAKIWLPYVTSSEYDPRVLPPGQKRGCTVGMGMTEKQGGSDVRANTTRAVPDGADAWGQRYRLVGHKWFFSAPMCDAFLVLAQTASGLSCLFLPRVLPDGTRNAIRVQRLKDKLGNKANASSEVEFHDAVAWLVGEDGRGIPQILEMGTMTRLDCALGTSGLMRQALSIALNHTVQRQAFGKPLIAQPLMRNVLADLALESEAATALAIRLARAFDRAGDAHEVAMARLLTPVAKYWICKRGSHFAQEAMECLGGNGYVEEGGEGIMARIYREMPLNSIWEGAGNIMAIDLLRALRRADAAAALAQELAPAKGAHPALDRLAAALPVRVEEAATELEARRLAQDVALAVQAALLNQQAPAAVFAAFCDSRIAGNWGHAFGSLGAGTDFDAILARAMPAAH